MKATADFLDRLAESERLRVLDLLDRAFDDDIYSSNTRNAFFRGYKSQSPNVVLLHAARDLAGVAIVGTRTIQMAGVQVKALTIGPLAIDPLFQKRGFSKLLMDGIDELAADLGALVAYLVGTPGFYRRYGYYPVLARTKVSLKTETIPSFHGVEVHPFHEQYLPEMTELFRVNAQMYSCASQRTEGDWEWLTRHGRDTYYFYNPHVVLLNHQVVGYFCSDSRTPGRIREALHGTDDNAMSSFLDGLKQFAPGEEISMLEVMTPANSPLHEYLRRGKDAIFTESIQSDGGQLMKVCDVEELLGQVQTANRRENPDVVQNQRMRPRPSSRLASQEGGISLLTDELIPGVLSGYIRTGTAQVHEDDVDVEAPFSQFSSQTPFIYQGDNF